MRKTQQKAKALLHQLGKDICRLSYHEIQKQICELDDDSLIELVNHRSRKVGDTAFELLNRRDGAALLVAQAILSNRFSHRDAKVRASNFLSRYGRKCLQALRAYVHLLDDKNLEVVHQGLWGIVFFQDMKQIETLKDRRDLLPAQSEHRRIFDDAIRALEERDPFIFSPGFHDATDVWRL